VPLTTPHRRAALEIAWKELREGLRDRQTVLYTFLLPIALYPVLFWVMVQGALLVRGKEDATNVRVALVAFGPPAAAVGDRAPAAPPSELVAALVRADLQLEAGLTPPDTLALDRLGETRRSPVGRLDLEAADFGAAELDDSALAERAAAALAADEDLAAVLVVGSNPSDEAPLQVFYDSTRSRSGIAEARLQERLADFAELRRADVARTRSVDVAELMPLEVRARGLATSAEEGALALSLLLPMLLVVMAVMGSFFPAVDLTAGEKERRTAETTLLLPLPRTSVHLGKILAVSLSGMVATALNILALGLSAGHLLEQMGADIDVQLPVGALLAVLPLALLFVFFVSAVLTGIAGLAATFKEGQALLGPVQMLFIFPAMAASLPGLQLGYGTALIPVVNVALAFRELLVGHASVGPVLVTAAALCVYALLALRASVHLLSREGVALAGETIPLKRLFGLLKGDGDTR